MVVAAGAVEQVDAIVDGASLRVGGGVDDAAEAGVGDGASAHGAGLEGDVQVAAIEAASAAGGEGGADGLQFGMGGGIGELAHAIALGGEDAIALHDDGADRGFTGGGGFRGEIEGEVHGAGHEWGLAFRVVNDQRMAACRPPLEGGGEEVRVALGVAYIERSGESPLPIRQLPEDLINRIAAGEVVERPASVIKELVENAVDAGARRIAITTAGGGIGLMRIEDDGVGMDEADLLLSVERHATSKLADGGLDDIRTLGFRGEALASIGSVAELTISTRQADAETGVRLAVRHGAKSRVVPVAMNRGTIVEVRELFANVPARRKCLKSERAEASAITDTVKRLAMANPDVHFVLDGADRSASNWPGRNGDGALRARLGDVMGAEFGENAVTLAMARHGMVVTGLAGLPTFTKANSLSQYFFVNGRSVKDKVLVGAVRAAYADFVFRDRFPVVALFVAVEPADVDVNVHPAKAELRFRDAGAVRGAVIRAIGEALSASGYRAASTVAEDVVGAFRVPEFASPAGPFEHSSQGLLASNGSTGAIRPAGRFEAPPPLRGGGSPQASALRFSEFDEPSARFEVAKEVSAVESEEFPLGTARAQMFDNFIVAQNGDSLLLVDQHAAHERLVYERFKAQLASGPVASQMQLIPVVIELPEDDCARLEEAAPMLEKLGLYLERFGARAVAVRETPALLGQADIDGLVRDLADGLAEWDSTAALADRLEAIIGRMACHGSVRSGRRLKVEEMNALLREMEATPHSGQCIHGRPTYVELKKADIERLFGRTR